VRDAGGTPRGGYAGSPIGVVTVDGVRYVALANDARVTAIRL
jgi:hypothetical protein